MHITLLSKADTHRFHFEADTSNDLNTCRQYRADADNGHKDTTVRTGLPKLYPSH